MIYANQIINEYNKKGSGKRSCDLIGRMREKEEIKKLQQEIKFKKERLDYLTRQTSKE